MAKVKLTAGRVAGFKCEAGKSQAFLWCADSPGLAVRATGTGAKAFIFQSRVDGKPLRMTIGDVKTWGIDAAQVEARRLQTLIDNGDDPRQIRFDKQEAKAAAAAAAEKAAKAVRDSVTLGDAWPEYVADRTPHWAVLTIEAHVRAMQPGGVEWVRNPDKLTCAGELVSLATVRLADLTPEVVEDWARVEGQTRPSRARLALRLLRAFLFWCARHKVFKTIIKGNAGQSKTARESLGKNKIRNDVLQREQLPAWFSAVRQIGNPVYSAYFQTLLLLGCRREELANLKWEDVDFQWNHIKLNDKVEEFRMVPLTPFVSALLAGLPRRSKYVFSSTKAVEGRISNPQPQHAKACAIAGLELTLHGLRRSFASLCEWVECPSGISAQIQGHAPVGVREQNYIRRPLDLLRQWHTKIEIWILEQAQIEFVPEKAGLQLVKGAA